MINSSVSILWKSVAVGIPQVFRGRSHAAASLQSIVARILIIALNLSTSVITARLLGAEGRGEQAAMVLWQGLFAAATTLGLPSSLIYNLKRRPEKEAQLFGAALLLGCVFGCAAGAIGVLFLPVWLVQYSPSVVRQAQFLMINTPLAATILICRAALEARGDYRGSNQTLLLTPLFTLGGLLLLIWLNAFSPFTTSLVYAFAGLPVTIWTLASLWRVYRPNLQDFSASSSDLLGYGARSYGVDLLNTVSLQIDQVLVIGLLAPEAMGMYTVALNLSRMLLIFQSSFATVLFPRIAAQSKETVLELAGQAARISTAIAILASAAMMLLGPVVMRTLYGSEFDEAALLLNVLILEAGLSGTASILTQPFMALGKPGAVTILQAVGLTLAVPLLIVLIPRYGMHGATVALLCSAIFRLILVQICFPLLLKTAAPSLLIKRADFAFLKRGLAN